MGPKDGGHFDSRSIFSSLRSCRSASSSTWFWPSVATSSWWLWRDGIGCNPPPARRMWNVETIFLGNRFFWWMGNRLLIQILLINAFGPFGGFEGLDSSCLFYVGTQNKSHSKQVICLWKLWHVLTIAHIAGTERIYELSTEQSFKTGWQFWIVSLQGPLASFSLHGYSETNGEPIDPRNSSVLWIIPSPQFKTLPHMASQNDQHFWNPLMSCVPMSWLDCVFH